MIKTLGGGSVRCRRRDLALVGVRGEGDRSYPNRVFYSRISVHTALKYSPIRQGLAAFLP